MRELAREVAKVVALATAALVLGACMTSQNVVAAPLDVTIGSVKEASIEASGGKADSGTCTLWLTADVIQKSSSGCYMDQHVSEETGELTFPCSGEGVAEARFGEHRYEGTVRDGRLSLDLETQLDWEDGCKWGTHHTIRGVVVKNGTPVLEKLSWRYADRVLSGDDCSGACTAKTELSVMKTRQPTPRTIIHADDDDDD